MARLFRNEIELRQPYTKHKGFTHTNTGDVAEDVVSVSRDMAEGNRIALVVDTYDAYIEFDGDASSSSMLIPAGSGYFDDGICIELRISAINIVAGQNTRVRGIVWGR